MSHTTIPLDRNVTIVIKQGSGAAGIATAIFTGTTLLVLAGGLAKTLNQTNKVRENSKAAVRTFLKDFLEED